MKEPGPFSATSHSEWGMSETFPRFSVSSTNADTFPASNLNSLSLPHCEFLCDWVQATVWGWYRMLRILKGTLLLREGDKAWSLEVLEKPLNPAPFCCHSANFIQDFQAFLLSYWNSPGAMVGICPCRQLPLLPSIWWNRHCIMWLLLLMALEDLK